MKIINTILGCALTTSLMTFAIGTAQAEQEAVFTPLNITLKLQYTNSKGRVREANLTSKDILNLLGFPKGDQLATDYEGSGDGADVYVIDKNKSVVEDLTTEDIFSIDFNDIVDKYQKSGKHDSFDNAERGILSLSFDFTENVEDAIVVNEDVPQSGNEFSFAASGVYTWNAQGAAVKNDQQKVSTKLVTVEVSGTATESTEEPEPTIRPDVDQEGNGDYLIKTGTVNGTGNGTIGFGG